MTSKISFSNKMKEDRKRRIWTIVLFTCLCLVFTVAFELIFENMNNMLQGQGITEKEYMDNIINLTGRGAIPYYLLLSGIGAMLFGFQGFGWLMKKQQVDFYHSLPVTRTKRFFIVYLNGILFFFIPLLIHTGLVALLVGVRGAFTKTVVVNIITNLGLYMLAFLLMYHLVILAVMMTGNILVSLLAAFTFLFYASALQLTINSYYELCFQNYVEDNTFSWLGYLSPFERILRAFQISWIGKNEGWAIPILIVMAGAVLLLAWKLYLMRPSECAGRALAFPKTGNVIRILIVVPIAMVSGLCFSLMSGDNSKLWAYIGSVIGVVFYHGFIEVIFCFDIKAAFRKKLQLAGTLAVTLLIVSMFQFDWFGYDNYLPKPEELKTVSYSIDLENWDDFYYKIGKDGVPTATYLIQEQYQYSISKTKDVEKVYELVKAGMEKNQYENAFKLMGVCYELKNGKKIYRQYAIGSDLMKEKFAALYESEQGKEVMYPALKLSTKNVEKISCYTPFMDKILELNQKEMKELLDMYQKDLREKTFSQYLEEKQVGSLSLTYQLANEKNSISYPLAVMDSYQNTMAYLKQKGISMDIPNDEYEIEEMRISYSEYYEEDILAAEGDSDSLAVMDSYSFQEGEEMSLTKKQQEQIIPYMVAEEYKPEDSLKTKDYAYAIVAVVKNKKTEVSREVKYALAKEDAPDFLRISSDSGDEAE